LRPPCLREQELLRERVLLRVLRVLQQERERLRERVLLQEQQELQQVLRKEQLCR
jgi:hypothetical protein